MEKKRVAIVGATGYAGAELTAILARHPQTDVVSGFRSEGSSSAPIAYGSLHPSLSGVAGPAIIPFDEDAFLASKPDVVFLATPNETSADLVPRLAPHVEKVIDLSGSFRLSNPASYPDWYGFAHPDPALLQKAAYGLTEHCNGELKSARVIANPGCYPTAILLALLPVAGFLDPFQPIVCDAMSGVSGAGKKSDVDYSFAELSGNFKAYGVGKHRHTPEIREQLHISDSTPLVFVPHLLPTVRGILATIHVGFAGSVKAEELAEAYAKAYDRMPFVSVRPAGSLPELRHVVNTPRAEIGFSLIDNGKRAVIVSVIDNLLKGAASQAVQNFNRAFEFDEKEGLA